MMIPNDYASIFDFANSLRVDFNTTDTIPILKKEEDWKEWGNVVASSPSFQKRSVPTTENFPNWKEWGIILYDTMAR